MQFLLRIFLLCLLLALIGVPLACGQSQEQSVSVSLRDLTRLTPGESLLIQPEQTLLQGNQPRAQLMVRKTSRREVQLTVQFFCPESAPQPGSLPNGANRLIRTEPWYDRLARWIGYTSWIIALAALLYWQRERLGRIIQTVFARRK